MINIKIRLQKSSVQTITVKLHKSKVMPNVLKGPLYSFSSAQF